MGPIKDELGLEQGSLNSGEYFKLYSNENLIVAQKSQQGIPLPHQHQHQHKHQHGVPLPNPSGIISAVGLADDTILASNKLSKLANILFLTTNYCNKYGVTLSHAKTKLLKISRKEDSNMEVFNPISIDGHTIDFSKEAEHVGIVRSAEKGNLSHIIKRILESAW